MFLEFLTDLNFLAFVFIVVFVGTIVGVLPGLGGSTGLAVLIPLVFGLDPTIAIALLIGMLAVTTTGDSFSSILLGVPGTAGSQATIIDGYAMSRQGRCAAALGAAFTSSLIGGVIGAVALFGLVSVARPLILALRSPELLMLCLLGILTVALVSEGALIRGLVSASIGLGLGVIGPAPAAAGGRFTFGSFYLFDGISIIILTLGLFAIPELTRLMASGQRIAEERTLDRSRWNGAREVFRNPRLVAQSASIGVGVGMVPGLGGHVVDWFAYGAAKRTVKGNTFGSGDIRGVIAPEAANNAKEGGALIPTLLFGVPGSPSMAVFLGALMLLGINPGPSMLTTNYGLTVAIIATLVVANIMATSLCFLITPISARITRLRSEAFGPVLFVVFAFAAFQVTRSSSDLLLLFASGAVGLILMYLGWSRIPLTIAFVLVNPIERYLLLSYGRYGWTWLSRPLVLVMIVLMVVVLVSPLLRKVVARRSKVGAGQ
jgi:TctA family transporter